jgi:hypothetical protein
MLQTCIQVVPSLCLMLNTGYLDWGLLWFPYLSPEECHDSILKQIMAAFFQILVCSSFMVIFLFHLTLYNFNSFHY